jgi:hypothetical protein
MANRNRLGSSRMARIAGTIANPSSGNALKSDARARWIHAGIALTTMGLFRRISPRRYMTALRYFRYFLYFDGVSVECPIRSIYLCQREQMSSSSEITTDKLAEAVDLHDHPKTTIENLSEVFAAQAGENRRLTAENRILWDLLLLICLRSQCMSWMTVPR